MYVYIKYYILHIICGTICASCNCKLILKNAFLFQNFDILYPFLANIFVFYVLNQLY